jgi:UDP-N-acetylmuramoyl-tripeptide--D-alanyl-D-alanine ligase
VAGVTDETIAAGLATSWGREAAHRGVLVDAPGLTILDDTYNASPPAVVASLELLATLPGRPVAVLGEMLELGPLHETSHRDVGTVAARVVAELVVVGEGAAGIAAGAAASGLEAGRIHRVADREAAAALLPTILRPGDVVLVKASRGAALESIVDALRPGLPGTTGGRP